MSIFLLGTVPNENWICDRFVNEWNKHNPDFATQNINDAEIIWLVADWCWKEIPLDMLSAKIVMATVHHIVPDKFNKKQQEEFIERDNYVDLYHVPCAKTMEQIKPFTNKPIWIQPFWVNSNIFRSLDTRVKRNTRKLLGIDKDAFVIGSFQRDTEEHGILKPKLEKGPDLFCDAVEIFKNKYQSDNRDVVVLLAAWRREYLMKRLDDAGIKYYFQSPGPFDLINQLYNVLDLYIVAARYEGGPQAIVECAASKIPIISTDVGLASEFLSHESIFEPGNALSAKPNTEYAHEKVQKYFIPTGFDEFINLFNGLLGKE